MPENYSTDQKRKPERHGLSNTSIYHAWRDMKRRVLNKNSSLYKDYGGRGVSICDEWRDSFLAFYKDMGDKPSSRHSLDRIDVDGDYCRENCRWASFDQQTQNQRLRVTNTSGYRGVSYHKGGNRAKAWAVKIGPINVGLFYTKEEAAEAYDKKAIELYGKHAKTNFEVSV